MSAQESNKTGRHGRARRFLSRFLRSIRQPSNTETHSTEKTADETSFTQITAVEQTHSTPLPITADHGQELAERDLKGQLFREMMLQLASIHGDTVTYYEMPGQHEPSIEREGAAWERYIVLNSADKKYGIAIHMLVNDPDWQSKGRLRMPPRGESNRLRLVFLKKDANILGSVVFSPDFESLIETYPDHHNGEWEQSLGEPFARRSRGRIESWEEGHIFVQDPTIHIGTTDRMFYTPPRNMTQDELAWLLDMLKHAEFDGDTMPNLIYSMTHLRHSGSRIVNADDPFFKMLKAGQRLIGKEGQEN